MRKRLGFVSNSSSSSNMAPELTLVPNLIDELKRLREAYRLLEKVNTELIMSEVRKYGEPKPIPSELCEEIEEFF